MYSTQDNSRQRIMQHMQERVGLQGHLRCIGTSRRPYLKCPGGVYPNGAPGAGATMGDHFALLGHRLPPASVLHLVDHVLDVIIKAGPDAVRYETNLDIRSPPVRLSGLERDYAVCASVQSSLPLLRSFAT